MVVQWNSTSTLNNCIFEMYLETDYIITYVILNLFNKTQHTDGIEKS